MVRAQSLAQVGKWEESVAAYRSERERRLRGQIAVRESGRAAVRPPPRPPLEPGEFVIVTGLPRSGTSLMMQMLAAGGLEPMTDGVRAPNEDNPRGFLEWEAVKRLPSDPSVLDAAKGKAVKVLTPLLPHLPGVHRYKILFMRRPTAEVVRSQLAMLERSGKPPRLEAGEIGRRMEAQAGQLLKALGEAKQVELLVVDYPELVADPSPWIVRIAAFLGGQLLPRPEAMAAVVDPALRRQG